MLRDCIVYWLHLPEHTDPSVEGYVGKTVSSEARWRAHRKSNRFPASYIETVLFTGTECECLAKERELRDGHSIGWNVMPGGGEPPSQKGKKQRPRTFTENHRRNLSIAHLGQRAWNAGLSAPALRGEQNPAKRPEVRQKISAAKLLQPSCIKVEINGYIYQSIGAASRALNIPKTTLRRQLTGENLCAS